jgi:hypothetical protein
MRDRIAFGSSATTGNPTPRLAPCKLYVNGDYKGLYIAAEPVRKDFMKYRYGSDDDGPIYEQQGHGSDALQLARHQPGSYVPGVFIEETADAPQNYSRLVQLMDILNNKAGDDRRNSLAALIDYRSSSAISPSPRSYGDNDDIAHWGRRLVQQPHLGRARGRRTAANRQVGPRRLPGRFYSNADQPLGYQWSQVGCTKWIAEMRPPGPTTRPRVAAVLNARAPPSRPGSTPSTTRSARPPTTIP